MVKKYFKIFYKNFKSQTFELINYDLKPRNYKEQEWITSNDAFHVFELNSFIEKLSYNAKYISEVKIKKSNKNPDKINSIFIIQLKRLTYKSTWEWLIALGLNFKEIDESNKKKLENILNEKRMKYVKKYLETIGIYNGRQ